MVTKTDQFSLESKVKLSNMTIIMNLGKVCEYFWKYPEILKILKICKYRWKGKIVICNESCNLSKRREMLKKFFKIIKGWKSQNFDFNVRFDFKN